MHRQRPPIGVLESLRTLCLIFCAAGVAAAIPSIRNIKSHENQNTRNLSVEAGSLDLAEYDDYDADEVEDYLRKVEFPDLGGEEEDQYTIYEENSECFWCGTEVPEDDDEHRAATIYTHNIYLNPGTCVINKSPNYPARYPNNVDHRYTYTAHPDSIITFTVPVGGLQKSKGCHRDKLSVHVGNVIVKKCAQFYNFVMESATATMYIRFASNHRIRWHGYNGTVCASGIPKSTTTTTPTTTSTTTTTTPPPPIYCDDICGDVTGLTGRISLKNDADMVYPWVIIVDIMRNKVFVRCSGYLISRKHVVTAAFCFFQDEPTGIDNVMVRLTAGEYDISSSEVPAAQTIYSDNVTLYDQFDVNNGGGVYNMAVVTLPGKGFVLNSRVSPICMANTTVQTDIVGLNSDLYVTGFGWTQYDYPAINMTTAVLKSCPFTFAETDLICIFIRFLPSTPCHGDAGAAIYEKWTDDKYYAVGQINAITVDSCPLDGVVLPCPAVAFYNEWINNVTGIRLCNN